MLKAVQFGAGNIGRGFLGQLYYESGFETVYVDVDAALIADLNRRGSYPLRLVDSAGNVENLSITPVRAVDGRDIDAVAAELATADFAGTSVGVKVLPHIAPALAAGIKARAARHAPPLNIILCENQWHAAKVVGDYITPLLDEASLAYMRQNIGLVETVIGRMVPAPTEAIKGEDPLLMVVEPIKELPVSRAQTVGTFPMIVGTELAENFDAYEARKLFIHNAAHAALAYLGYGKHEFIWQCALDPEIRAECLAAINESERALVAAYGFDPVALSEFGKSHVYRFENKALGDPVRRVAADPLRKLRPSDRLIGAANLCLKEGIEPAAIARVINAALAYDEPGDPSAVELQRRLREEGRERFLAEHCAVQPGSELASLLSRSAGA